MGKQLIIKQFGGNVLSHLQFEVKNNVAFINLNRPKSLNAFSLEMINNWIESLKKIRDEDDIHVGILTGNGKAFCAGGDVKSMKEGKGFMNQSTEEIDFYSTPSNTKDSLWKHIQKIPLLMEEIDKPMIAAINGAAIGAGLDMALMCDYRICSDKAKLGEGYINAGIVPGDGGGYYLPRVVGIDKALELLWTGEIITAKESLDIGLVSRVVKQEDLYKETVNFAEQLAKSPQLSLRMTKRLVYESLSMSLKQSLDMASSFMGITVHHQEHKEKIKKMDNKD